MFALEVPCPKCGSPTKRLSTLGANQKRACTDTQRCGFVGTGRRGPFEWDGAPKPMKRPKIQGDHDPQYVAYLERKGFPGYMPQYWAYDSWLAMGRPEE